MYPRGLNNEEQGVVDLFNSDEDSLLDLSRIKRVVLEIHNYCNRKCLFCPNSIIDRKSSKLLMEESVYLKVLTELAESNFQNTLYFGRYHEPLSDKLIIDRISKAREILPNNKISLNTNGDFFNLDYARKLYKAGLDELKIMIYLPNRSCFTDKNALNGINRFSNRYDLNIQMLKVNKNIEYVYSVIEPEFKKDFISLHCENYKVDGFGCDRGGSLTGSQETQIRDIPCFAPYFEINIDFNGNVMPCCNLLSDVKAHEEYILGNVKNNSLKDIFSSQFSRKFRYNASKNSPINTPCITCKYFWPNRIQT